MRPALAIAMFVATLSHPALAQDVPRYDIRSFCAVNGTNLGGPMACQQIEEAARIEIGSRWETFPKQRKHFCVQSVGFKKKEFRSYNLLIGCLRDTRTS